MLTQLLLYVESLVDAAGCVHSESWRYRRLQWTQDLQRLSFQLPVLLPTPGQPQEVSVAAASSPAAPAAATAAAAPSNAGAATKRLKKLDEDSDETTEVLRGSETGRGVLEIRACKPSESCAAAEGATDISAMQLDTSEASTNGAAAQADTPEAPTDDAVCTGGEAAGPDERHEEAQPPSELACSVSAESIAAAVAAATCPAGEAASAATAKDGEDTASAVRFDALVRCFCCGFGWRHQFFLELLDGVYEETFGPTRTAAAGRPADGSSSQQEDLQWLAVSKRLDLVNLWGLYLNVWKASGIDCQRLTDINAPIERQVAVLLLLLLRLLLMQEEQQYTT